MTFDVSNDFLLGTSAGAMAVAFITAFIHPETRGGATAWVRTYATAVAITLAAFAYSFYHTPEPKPPKPKPRPAIRRPDRQASPVVPLPCPLIVGETLQNPWRNY